MSGNRKTVTMSHSLIDNSEVEVELDLDELKAANNGNRRAERNVIVAYKTAYQAKYGTWLGDMELHDLNSRTWPVGQPA